MITRLVIRVAIVVAVTVGLVAVRIHDDPEHIRPPHAVRLTGAIVQQGEPDIYGAVADTRAAWFANEERLQRERDEAIAKYLSDLAAFFEAVARQNQARPQSAGTSGPSTRTPTACDGHVVPAYIVQRESGCDYGAVNPTGCGGASCVGLYQFDLRHFTSGQCVGLDWHNPADQDECARRISNNGTNLKPWGQ